MLKAKALCAVNGNGGSEIKLISGGIFWPRKEVRPDEYTSITEE